MRFWVLALMAVLVCAMPATAAPKEDKLYIYFVYDQGSPIQRKFINSLYDRFKLRGFRDFLKKEGVNWVEGNYGSLGGVLNYLDITRDDLIYFAVVTADKSDRLIREIARVRVGVSGNMTDKQILKLADKMSNVFYYDMQNTLDLFHNGTAWKRQAALIAPEGEPLSPVSISMGGKEAVTGYKRSVIGTVMVPYQPAFFKQLGIEGSTSPWRGGGSIVHLRHGGTRLDFYSGTEIQDRKIYELTGGQRQFLRPTEPQFAYPELRNGTVYLPLHLAITRLGAPVEYNESGDKVTLTAAGHK